MVSLIKFNGFGGKKDGDGQVEQINERDGVETNSERLLPGQSPIERLRWILEQGNAGLIIPTLTVVGRLVYLSSPIEHLHLLVWLVLGIYIFWIGLERLNALPYVKTWSLFSSALIWLIAGFGLAVLFGLL